MAIKVEDVTGRLPIDWNKFREWRNSLNNQRATKEIPQWLKIRESINIPNRPT